MWNFLVALDSDSASTFGVLEIQGLRRYPDSFVKRMNTIASDEACSQAKLLEIGENPSQKLGFGIGASTDIGAHGQVDCRDLNFLDSAWLLSGAFKLEQKSQSVSGDLQFPPTETGFRCSVGFNF